MIQLKENRGIPRSILLMMAIIAGLTVANCYYNQPLLELIRHDLGITEQSANLITVITQIGYALGLFFLIPLGDMFSRKKLILANMTIAAVMAIVMAVAQNVWMLWGASLLIGACSVIPQFFIPIAGQFSEPKNKSRNMGIVLSGLLTGILASRVISGYIGEWLGWREMFFIAALVMIACMAYQVVMRYFFHKGNAWSEELARLMCIWVVMLGASIATRTYSHLQIDVFINLVPERTRHLVTAILTLIGVIFVAIMLKYSIDLFPCRRPSRLH